MRHSEIQQQLYDYLLNGLDAEDRRQVALHLHSCTQCSDALNALRQTLALLPNASQQPGDERDDLFWQSLSLRIEQEIREQGHPRQNVIARRFDSLLAFLSLRPAYGIALGGSLAAIVVTMFFLRFTPGQKEPVAVGGVQPIDSTSMLARYQTQQRMSRYFDKSEMLLVGIANMKTDEENIDLSAERNLSRSLVHEARFLKQQPMDERSAKLIRDLDKVLIELANLEEDYDLPDVELIRGGIHQENLLFKIRMAEARLPDEPPGGAQSIRDTSDRANTIY